MVARFVNLDRQTQMFLPCDLRDWLPDGQLVHLILDAVKETKETLDILAELSRREKLLQFPSDPWDVDQK